MCFSDSRGVENFSTQNRFGDWLREELRSRKISLRELGRATELDPATLSRLSSGKQRPTLSHLARLGQALGVSLPDLLNAAGYGSCEESRGQKTGSEAPDPLDQMLRDAWKDGPGARSARWADVARQVEDGTATSLAEESLQAIERETFAKIGRIHASEAFAAKVRDLYGCVFDPKGPSERRALAASALAYFVSEADVIPDGAFPVGFIDDAIAVESVWNRLFDGGPPKRAAARPGDVTSPDDTGK